MASALIIRRCVQEQISLAPKIGNKQLKADMFVINI